MNDSGPVEPPKVVNIKDGKPVEPKIEDKSARKQEILGIIRKQEIKIQELSVKFNIEENMFRDMFPNGKNILNSKYYEAAKKIVDATERQLKIEEGFLTGDKDAFYRVSNKQ